MSAAVFSDPWVSAFGGAGVRTYLEVDGSVRRPTAVLPRFGSAGSSLADLAEWFSVAAATTARGMRVVVTGPEPVAALSPRTVVSEEGASEQLSVAHTPGDTELVAAVAEVARAVKGRALPVERADRNDGFCYLELVRDVYRASAAKRYGAWPVFCDLVDMPLEWLRPPEECVQVGVVVRGGALHFQYGGGDGQLSAYDLLVYARGSVTRARGSQGTLPSAIMQARVGGRGGTDGCGLARGEHEDPHIDKTLDIDCSSPGGWCQLRPPEVVVSSSCELGQRASTPSPCESTLSYMSEVFEPEPLRELDAICRETQQLIMGGDVAVSSAVRKAYLVSHFATEGCCLRGLLRRVWGPVGSRVGQTLPDVLRPEIVERLLSRTCGDMLVTLLKFPSHVCVLEGHVGWPGRSVLHVTLREAMTRHLDSTVRLCRGGRDVGAEGWVCDQCGYRYLDETGHAARCRLPTTIMPAAKGNAWLGDALHVFDVRAAIQDAAVDSVHATTLAVTYVSAAGQVAYLRAEWPQDCGEGLSVRALSTVFEAEYASRYREPYLRWLRRELGLSSG